MEESMLIKILMSKLISLGQNFKGLGLFGLVGIGGFFLYTSFKSKQNPIKDLEQNSIKETINEIKQADQSIKEDEQKISDISVETVEIQHDIKEVISEPAIIKPTAFAEIQAQIEAGWKKI